MNPSATGMFLLARLSSAHPEFWENLQYQAIGMAIVFFALGLIWGCMALSGAIFRMLPTRVSEKNDGEELRRVAVLAAAVHTAVGRPLSILSIESLDQPRSTHSPWSAEGRRQIFLSHRVR